MWFLLAVIFLPLVTRIAQLSLIAIPLLSHGFIPLGFWITMFFLVVILMRFMNISWHRFLLIIPLNSLFKMLHEQHFDDLCEIDSDSLHLSPTFWSTSFGSLFWLDYIWISPSFPIPYLWSSVSDLTNVFPTDNFLVTAHFDFFTLTRK